MNKVIMIGRLVSDPEKRTTQNGNTTASVRIAVKRRFKNANGQYDSDFFNVVAWRSNADFLCNYFRKGNQIGVEGSLQSRSYEAQDGSKRTAIDIVAENFDIIDAKNAQPQAQAADDAYTPVDDDDLPF